METREGSGIVTDDTRYPFSSIQKDTNNEEAASIINRNNRFVNNNAKEELFLSSNVNKLKPYYNGEMVDSRMTQIRQSINYIRNNWDKFDGFLQDLKLYMEKNGFDFEAEYDDGLKAKSFLHKRDWVEPDIALPEESFDIISLYTNDDVYNAIFQLLSKIFRNEDSPELGDIITNAVFLTELMNIDLFNYCQRYPERSHYQGVVYRGMGITEAELDDFKMLRKMAAKDRYIAIPLSLMSATSDLKVAEGFMESTLKANDKKYGLLYQIHVINLKKEHLQFYRQRFPSSVVSSICAVEIAQLSVYENESEVLLRGAFFQVLDVYKSDIELAGKPYYILEVVMLNTNRDHISSSFLGKDEAPARALFGAMVRETRAIFACKYYNKRKMSEDENEFDCIVEECREKLKTLML